MEHGTMEPLITNNRAKREWDWIVAKVGEQAAREALGKLPGNRKPYPLNVARALGLQLPAKLAEEPPASREQAREYIAQIKQMLGSKQIANNRLE